MQLKHGVLKLLIITNIMLLLVKTNQCRPSFEFFGALQFHFETIKFLFMTLTLTYRAQWRLNKFNVPKFYNKKANWRVCKPNSERILHSSQDSTGHMSVWFQHNSGTTHITYDFQAALVGFNSMVFGQRYITFSTTSILDFSSSSSASKISWYSIHKMDVYILKTRRFGILA